MKIVARTIVALLFALPLPGAEPAAPRAADSKAGDGPMPVFILAGQSNMNGVGKVEELPADLKEIQPDSRFASYWGTELKPLNPAKLGRSFGPELTFGREMSRALKRPVGMIKLANGGTSIEQHWNPITFDKEKHIGELYKRLTEYIRSIQAKNKDIKIVGIIWMQGEADALYHSKTTGQYRDKLEALIDGLRQTAGDTGIPFVCGRVNPPGAKYIKQVREAQETVKREKYAWFDCDDIEKHSDKLHYNTKGQIELGRRFAAAMLKLMNVEPAPPAMNDDVTVKTEQTKPEGGK